MGSKVSVRQAQDHLAELFARAEGGSERFIVESNGQPLGALVSLADLEWIERLAGDKDGEIEELRQQRLAKGLGRKFTLPSEKAQRLKELVEKEDEEEILTTEEMQELEQLMEEHEELVVRRAKALGEVL